MPRAKPKQLPGLIITRIVSGGQTGVDRAALDAAMALNIPHGGWCPRGRLAEDGPIPKKYELRESESSDYANRTEQNVLDSDGTLILYRQRLQGGTLLTNRLAKQHEKPLLRVRLEDPVPIAEIHDWLASHQIRILNIAGPRASSQPGIYDQALALITKILTAPRGRKLFSDAEPSEDLA